MTDVDLHLWELDRFLRSDLSWIGKIGNQVRDEARSNARSARLSGHRAPRAEDAIVSMTGQDSEGPYADVGYSRHHPGFYLWWWEVGTRYHHAVPHLRPALKPGLIR